MQTTSPEKIVHEIAVRHPDNDEKLVSKMYAEALEDYRPDARIIMLLLFAAKRVRQNLQSRTATEPLRCRYERRSATFLASIGRQQRIIIGDVAPTG